MRIGIAIPAKPRAGHHSCRRKTVETRGAKEHAARSGCPIACTLDIVGDHWTLLIIRDLMFLGLHEYKDMLMKEEGISSNILTDRLKKLERKDLIEMKFSFYFRSESLFS